MEIDFAPYLGHFFPFFVGGLSDCEHITLCKAALGAVEEAMYASPAAFVSNFEVLMGALLKSLKNPDMDFEVKPIIIHCIGIVAFNMEGAFENYIADVTVALTCAVTVVNQKVLENEDDDDMVWSRGLWVVGESVGNTHTRTHAQKKNANTQTNCNEKIIK